MKPAGLGKRIAAALMDIVIVSALSYAICIPLFKLFHFKEFETRLQQQLRALQLDPTSIDPEFLNQLMPALLAFSLIGIVLLVLMHTYYVFFEAGSGQTPGKKMFDIRVVNLQGGPITQKQALYREMIRWYVDGLFVFPAFIAMFSNPRRQRVGDLLAKTMVIESAKNQ